MAYGIANGLKAVLRATLPLALFGRAQFGTYLGRLALPQGIVSASAPPVLAAVMASYGAEGVLALTFVIAMIALVTTVMLVRVSARCVDRHGHRFTPRAALPKAPSRPPSPCSRPGSAKLTMVTSRPPSRTAKVE